MSVFTVDSKYGMIIYMKDGQKHRDGDLPAVIHEEGRRSEEWWKDGKLHRDGGKPAIVFEDGHSVWYIEGKLCRENGLPHVVSGDGSKRWYEDDGELGRGNDLPSVISADGSQRWYKNGVLHRDVFPAAVIPSKNTAEWWTQGVKIKTCVGFSVLEYLVDDSELVKSAVKY